ncbi:MAG: hypothetical protein M3Q71_00450 [Chloroflexota bacterium]|nr:hypothetical protein [Chloroflexota bacterium]
MSVPVEATKRRRGTLPAHPRCAGCGTALGVRFGWCGNCRAAYCFGCGRAHFCTPSCPAGGCHAGLCVRLATNGVLSETWGLPDEESAGDGRR